MSNNVYDKKSIKEIGEALLKLRREKNLFLYQVARQTEMPAKVIEGLELGRYIKYGKLRRLAEFYNKKIHIVME